MVRAHVSSLSLLFAFLVFVSPAWSQQPAPATQAGPTHAPALKIVLPRPGEHIPGTFVTVKYEVNSPKGTSSNLTTFELKLDGREGVQTIDHEHTFTGLSEGAHTVSIDVLDKEGSPVSGTHSTIDFIVLGADAPTRVPDHSGDLKSTSLRRGARRGQLLRTSYIVGRR